MKFSVLRNWLAVASLASVLAVTGCATSTQTTADAPPPATQSTQKADMDKPRDVNHSGSVATAAFADSGRTTNGVQATFETSNVNSLRFPGVAGAPVVLEKSMPSRINAGLPFEYDIIVYNTADYAVTDVVVTEQVPGKLSIVSSIPEASAAGDELTWELGSIEGGESKVITVTAETDAVGSIKTCATITYVPLVCVETTVVKPDLEITKTLPEEVLLCDIIAVTYIVTNPGSGTLTDVTVIDELPEGLTVAASGNETVQFNVDRLEPGQSRAFRAELKATEVGEYSSPAVAEASEGLKSDSEATVIVRQPVLTIDKSGTDKQWAGRTVTYTITVGNIGDAPATSTIVTDTFQGSVEFVSASDGGVFDGNVVTWDLGTLAVDANRTVTVTVRPLDKGTISNTSTVSAVCAEDASDSASTNVAGIPAVLLEVIDLEDPIRIGDNVTYEITVTNQGTARDTNIVIVAELEGEMEFVSATGEVNYNVAGGTITFEPLPELAAKAQSTYRVTVKAAAEADVRFRVTMETDNLKRPVIETEATNFYNEITP